MPCVFENSRLKMLWPFNTYDSLTDATVLNTGEAGDICECLLLKDDFFL